MTDQTDAQVLAALEVLGWPDDREASAHIEPDGYEVTPARHYWDLVTSVLTAAEAARFPLVSLLPEGMTEAEVIERFRVALEQPQRITVLPPSESDRERGVAEGRRQATATFIAECQAAATDHRSRYRPGPPPSPPGTVDDRPRDRRSLHVAIGLEQARDIARRRLLADGPWEPIEQPEGGAR